MKSTLLLLIVCLAVCTKAGAQSVKLYGYVQKVSPGIRATIEIDENGNRKKAAGKAMENYFMYLTSSSKSKIYLVEGWIRGERFGLKSQQVKTPVTLSSSLETGKAIELVPKTSATVLQLTGTDAMADKTFEKAKTLAKSNELVVVYKVNGKFQYATLKKFTQLSSSYLQ